MKKRTNEGTGKDIFRRSEHKSTGTFS
jgi:hypothetical protein